MSEFDLPAYLAGRVRYVGRKLEKAVAKMPEDRQTWEPVLDGNTGRNTQDQLCECGLLNAWCAQGLQAGSLPAPDWDAYNAQKATLDTPEKALAAFKEGTEALTSALAASSAAILTSTFVNPFSGQETDWVDFVEIMYWNMCYHEGQINYIQTLYGDVS